MPRPTPPRDYVRFAGSFAIGAVFIYAGITKLSDPLQFADTIAAFAILPFALINPLALALPLFEIACGVMLLARRTGRVAALAAVLTSAIFFAAVLSALLRGLVLDCGCFGSAAPSRPRMWLELGLDAVLFSGALLIYLRAAATPPSREP